MADNPREARLEPTAKDEAERFSVYLLYWCFTGTKVHICEKERRLEPSARDEAERVVNLLTVGTKVQI